MMFTTTDKAISEVAKAIRHDREMEDRYKDAPPIEDCLTIAADCLGVNRDSVYIVSFSFVLGSYKAWCSSYELHEDHGTYCEVVHNMATNEWYGIKYEETRRETYLLNDGTYADDGTYDEEE